MSEQDDLNGREPASAPARRDLPTDDSGGKRLREELLDALRNAPTGDSEPFIDPKARVDLSHVDVTELAGNPFERKANWRNAFRGMGSRGWAAAALAVAVLLVAWNLRPASTPQGVATTVDGVVQLSTENPRALREQIVSELRSAGVDANGYEQLGTIGIDANLPRPLNPNVQRVLVKHGIPSPSSGELRVELTQR